MAKEAAGSEVLRSSVFEALPDGILITDLGGRIVKVNQQLVELSKTSLPRQERQNLALSLREHGRERSFSRRGWLRLL